MSASAIRAGKAFIEFFAQDKTKAGFDKVERRLKSFAGMVIATGAALTAAASAALGGFGAALKDFADFGGGITDAMSRTSLSSELLQSLSFSAAQAGGSLNDVVAAARTMNKTIAAGANGNKTAIKNLAALGLTAEQLLAMSPDERFKAIAQGISQIDDPAMRSAAAMKVLGKSASNLMESLAGGADEINRTTAELKGAGLILSPEDIANADKLGDAWGSLTGILRMGVRLIGAALAPSVTDLIERAQEWVTWITKLIDGNRELIRWIAYGAVVLFALGAIITTVGTALFVFAAILGAIPAIVAGIGTVFAALGSILAVVFSPIGLLVAGILALAAALPVAIYLFDQLVLGGMGLRFVSDAFWELWGIASQTVSGIFDAISTGNWALAGEIAVAGLAVALVTGYGWIKMGLLDLFTWISGKFVDFFGQEIIGIVAGGLKRVLDLINAGTRALGGTDLVDTSGLKAVVASADKGTLKADLNKAAQLAREGIKRDIANAKQGLTDLTVLAKENKEKRFAPKPGGRNIIDALPVDQVVQEFKQTISAGATNSAMAIRLGGQVPVFDAIKDELKTQTKLLENIEENTAEEEGLDD